jgi:hypothetical protein
LARPYDPVVAIRWSTCKETVKSASSTIPEVSERDEERLVQAEPEVLEGEDDLPRQPAPPLDPYTPEPGVGPGERKAFRVLMWAWVPLLVVVAIVVIAALR